MHARKSALAAAVTMALAVWQQPAVAAYDYSLNDYITLNILQNGDANPDYEEGAEGESPYVTEDLSLAYMSSFTQAFDYYYSLSANYIKASQPVRVQVTQISQNDDNASASSGILDDAAKFPGLTAFTAGLFYDWYGDSGDGYSESLAKITVDHGLFASLGEDWFLGTMHNLCYSGSSGVQSDLASTLVHEMAHAFGMLTLTEDSGILLAGNFANGLYDYTGKSIKSLSSYGISEEEGETAKVAAIALDGDSSITDQSAYFIVYSKESTVSGAYFTGTNTAEVLNGALIAWTDQEDIKVAGVPVNGFEPRSRNEDGTIVYKPEFSHLELKNGLMSHQSYRNYNTLMEAELAVLQDVGVPMDRRNLFGYSVYNSGESASDRRVFVNTNPYYARTSDGQWIEGQANETAYGIGLHVYGSYNDITQEADLLGSGLYGIGIRVDGAGNRITVASGTTVSSDGVGGKGLLVAYGKGHEVNVAGTVTAKGTGGNAVEFNFGDNNLGNHNGYRGSFIDKSGADVAAGEITVVPDLGDLSDADTLRDELDGALVDNFNLSGTLVGGENAIFISKNAYVENINLLSGASLTGDITSEWDYDADFIHSSVSFGTTGIPYLTTINFGVDEDGDADSSFSTSYDGSITGESSLIVNFQGGSTSLGLNAASAVKALAVSVAEDATLTTAASFDVSSGSALADAAAAGTLLSYTDVAFGTLTNRGTLAVAGNGAQDIAIEGDYVQSSTGTLAMRFGRSETDTLSVSGNATIDGTVTLSAGDDYFESGTTYTVALASLISGSNTSTVEIADSVVGTYAATASPTLVSSADITGEGESLTYAVTFGRSDNAYSQYASGDANSGAVAMVFDAVAANASSSLQEAIAAMDFSASDGSDITRALDSMNPAAFSEAVNGVLSHQRFLNDMGLDRMQREMRMTPGTYVYADPYLIRGRRGSGLYAVEKEHDFGVVAGIDSVNADSLCGVYLNLNNRSQKTKGRVSIRDKSIYAGVHGTVSLNEDHSLKAFGDGRVGADFFEQDRYVSVASYQEKIDTEYTAYGAGLQGGLDYELRLAEFTLNFNADLSYSYLRTPHISENGDLALYLDNGNFSSLKAGAGVSLSLPESKLEDGGLLGFKGTLRYHRELLDEAGSYTAYFKGASDNSFRQSVDFEGKDSVYAAFGGTYRDSGMAVGADIGGEFYPGEGRELFGRVNLSYRF